MKSFKYKNIFILSIIFIMIIIIIIISKYLWYSNNMNETSTDKGKKQQYINNSVDNKMSWETKYVQRDLKQGSETLLFIETKAWSQKKIYVKFNTIDFNNDNYISNGVTIQYQNIGNYIKETNVTAYDDKNIEQMITAKVYEIKNISNKCAIAIQFENDINYYIYINLGYVPNTLDELVNDLNLKEIISISSISYNYKYYDENGKEQNENIEFENVEKNDIWEILFYNLSLKNLDIEANLHREYIMSINCTISLLNSDVYINVTNDGYLVTNILGTEKVFFIGNEKKQKFVNYIVNNYVGYKIVYINDTIDETIYPEDKILTIDNTIER